MNKNIKSFKIHIFDEEYRIMSDESEEQIAKTSELVDSLMREIAHKAQINDPKKIAVLVALRLANQIATIEEEKARRLQHETDIIDRMEKDISALLT